MVPQLFLTSIPTIVADETYFTDEYSVGNETRRAVVETGGRVGMKTMRVPGHFQELPQRDLRTIVASPRGHSIKQTQVEEVVKADEISGQEESYLF